MERQISETMLLILNRKSITRKQLKERGINQSVYQSILQVGKYKGSTYTIGSLKKFCKAIDLESISLVIDGNTINVKI